MTDMVATRRVISGPLKIEFRAGFHRDRPAQWIKHIVYETEPPSPSVSKHFRLSTLGEEP